MEASTRHTTADGVLAVNIERLRRPRCVDVGLGFRAPNYVNFGQNMIHCLVWE